MLRAIADAGYSTPTPVQSQAIPVVLQGRDVLAGAQTGTGKTAAFALPLLHRLSLSRADAVRAPRHARALVLAPTRELAAQVEESFRDYGKYLPLTSTVVFGGVNIGPQIQALGRGVDVLVATPGRLLDHVRQKTVELSRVEALVLDEADRMLDMGFIHDIRRILALLPARRQNVLCSATIPDEIRALADSLLTSPVYIQVARANSESALVAQSVYAAAREDKRALLVHLLAQERIDQALVFTRTKHGADRLAGQLKRDGIRAAPIHGDRTQPQRTRALADFKSGAVQVLVATDIAARGLDIDNLPHVINFELPHVPEDYVHRIGRTGRAGVEGQAISLVSAEEQPLLAGIERLIRRPIARGSATGFTSSAASSGLPVTTAAAPVRPARSGPRPQGARRTGSPAGASGSPSRGGAQRPAGSRPRPLGR